MKQQHINFTERKGCCQCGRTNNAVGTTVTWRCCVCDGLVCMECCLVMPFDHPDYTGLPGTCFERQYYDNTYCSERCRVIEEGEDKLAR